MHPTIPSAEIFLINKLNETQPDANRPPTPRQVEEWMIEFAKMHVTEALKEAEQNIHINATCNICCSSAEIGFNENPIVNAYPLERIE